jgi:hypothetical protein
MRLFSKKDVDKKALPGARGRLDPSYYRTDLRLRLITQCVLSFYFYWDSSLADSINIGGFNFSPTALLISIRRTTPIPRTTRPKAAKP